MNRKFAIALLVFANVMWGSSYAVAKVALEELPPPLLGALRITLASCLIWLVLLSQPLVGSLLGLLVLREPLTFALIVGGALIFAALYFTSIPNRRQVSGDYQLPEAQMVE